MGAVLQVIDKMVYGEHRVSIYFGNGIVLVVPYGLDILNRLQGGEVVSTEDYATLEYEHLLFGCRSRALKYISIRQRSRFELITYLKKKGYDLSLITKALEFLDDKGLIDDREFANRFADYKFRSKVQGKNLL